jgi:hypothetical protein
MPIPRLIVSLPHARFRRYRPRDHALAWHYPHGRAWRATPLIGATYEGLKIPTRFALAMGKAIMMKDPNGNSNVVGESIIRCARLLSCDHGTHFLLDENTTRCLEQNHGSIPGGIQECVDQTFDGSRCTASKRLTATRKGAAYVFNNILLEYNLLNLKDRFRQERQKSPGHVFSLGMVDLTDIDVDADAVSPRS